MIGEMPGMRELQQESFFWGKFIREGSQYSWLPLSAHCLDVALVFRALCDLNGVRRTLTHASKTLITSQHLDRLAVLAMLHDAGKANLGFQRKVFDANAPKAGHIRELAPILDFQNLDEDLYVAFMQALPSEISSWFHGDRDAYSYLMAVFSHHGSPLIFRGEMTGSYHFVCKQWWYRQDLQDPMAAIAGISHWARHVFPHAFEPSDLRLPVEPAFHHRFAGLLMLADWLGSNRAWFPVANCQLEDRLQHDSKVIPTLLHTVGLDVTSLRPVLNDGPSSFKERFGFTPRPLQAAIDTLNAESDATRLVIAESETGSGKTEAALNWFFKLFAAGQVDGLYFALPTRVAARELYSRIKKIIDRWFPDPSVRPVTVLAVPGYAQVDGISPEQILPDLNKGDL
jgi:CRISPR-associated endonuclease/helicase Cas3